MKNNSDYSIKPILFRVISVTLSLFIVFIIIEFILRIFPISGIKMGSTTYDPEIRLYKFTPNTNYIRTNIREERIVRKINSEGFMDREHSKIKQKGVYRIGFFGDSYVEAIQVPLEKTFFRLIEDSLSTSNIEILAFGKSGHGTIHSYLINKKYSEYYDLDMVVYVFCENDLGDQIESIKGSPSFPYVELFENRIEINDDLLSEYVKKRKIINWLKRYSFYKNSIVLQTINIRVKMLMQHGIKIFTNQNDFEMSGKGDINKAPNENDLPSTWNARYKRQAILTGETVISKWFQDVRAIGKKFVILYIPRELVNSYEWKKDDIEQDSWKYWLKTYCSNNQIDFIDPTQHFFEIDSKGVKVYEDHFSEDGHVAFAKAFIEWHKKTKLEN